MGEATGEMRQRDTIVTANGLYNGMPHSVTFDTLEVLTEQAQLRGVTVDQKELQAQAIAIKDDIERVREIIKSEPPKSLRDIAAEFLSKFVPLK